MTCLVGKLTDVATIEAGVKNLLAEHTKVFDPQGKITSYAQQNCTSYNQQSSEQKDKKRPSNSPFPREEKQSKKEESHYEGALSFYNNGKWGELFSNCNHKEITYEGKEYPTTEHFFQASKFKQESSEFQDVLSAQKPSEALKKAKGHFAKMSQDDQTKWHKGENLVVMEKALRLKLGQHREVQELLKSTEGYYLVENTALATYDEIIWGCGGRDRAEPTGQNFLGRLWMKIRDDLPELPEIEKLYFNPKYTKKTEKDYWQLTPIL